MKFHVLTLFPEMIEDAVKTSITGRAIENNLISVDAINIRDFADNEYGQIDDYPYGGGAGMVMMAQPIIDAYESIKEKTDKNPRVVYLTPQGEAFNHDKAVELSKEDELVFLCGHYEGIDERAIEAVVTDEVSLGDFVVTGGELPALVMIDAISRLVPGVLNNDDSASDESFANGLLEYPQYTRPDTVEGEEVPEILLSGNHPKVDEWRRQQSLIRTYERRPDLLEKADLSEADIEFLDTIKDKQ